MNTQQPTDARDEHYIKYVKNKGTTNCVIIYEETKKSVKTARGSSPNPKRPHDDANTY